MYEDGSRIMQLMQLLASNQEYAGILFEAHLMYLFSALLSGQGCDSLPASFCLYAVMGQG